jgi:hypothetical protein
MLKEGISWQTRPEVTLRDPGVLTTCNTHKQKLLGIQHHVTSQQSGQGTAAGCEIRSHCPFFNLASDARHCSCRSHYQTLPT